MVWAAACILASVVTAGYDSVTLSHGTVLTGQVQTVTLSLDGRQRQIERAAIRSMTMAATPTGESTVVLEDKELTGQLIRVEIKTAAATVTVERSKMLSLTLGQRSAPATQPADDGEAQPAPQDEGFSDTVTLKIGHTLRAIVAAVQVDDRLHPRTGIESLKLDPAGDTLEMTDGKSVSGRLTLLRLRVGSGVVDLGRDEVTAVKLARVSADNLPPPRPPQRPSPQQEALLSVSGSAKEECVRKVAAARSDAMAKVAEKYSQPVGEADQEMRAAEIEAARAQERVNSLRNDIEGFRKDLDRTPAGRRWSIENRIREANRNANTAAADFRKAADKYAKAKSAKDQLTARRKADELAVARWADRQMIALARLQSKIGLLVLASVPLDEKYIRSTYEGAWSAPPGPQRDADDEPRQGSRTPSPRRQGRKSAPAKDLPAPGADE